MAYTSTVGLALTAEAHEKLKANVAKLPKNDRALLKNADSHRTKKGEHLYYWNCVYEEERSFLEGFVSTLPASEYHLCLVGDDFSDNYEAGDLLDPFDLRLRREVTVG